MFVESFEKQASVKQVLRRALGLKSKPGETLLHHQIAKLKNKTGTPEHLLLPESRKKEELGWIQKEIQNRIRRKQRV